MGFLPTLYKKTSTGAIQYWDVHILTGHPDGVQLVVDFGQVGTENPQTTVDLITSGKNIGKKNETTALQQAEREAKSKWEKQKKKGYVESIEAAKEDAVDDLIEGGVNPMLAQSFSKHGHKITYPCFAQPKLDGHRAIAIIENGKCSIWSRTRKRINSVPHINAELEAMYPAHLFKSPVILDGELYNHSYRHNFEELTSLIRQEHPAAGHESVEYHIYDQVMDAPFDERWVNLQMIVGSGWKYCKLVSTAVCGSEENVTELFSKMLSDGYEGLMLRNANSPYVNKRSYDLQKVKEFEDAEFQIVGAEEGRGKLIGHVGAFVCATPDGKEFLVKMSGSLDNLKRLFEDSGLWKGKKLTVQFQGLTGANGVPRFPVGLRIREDV